MCEWGRRRKRTRGGEEGAGQGGGRERGGEDKRVILSCQGMVNIDKNSEVGTEPLLTLASYRCRSAQGRRRTDGERTGEEKTRARSLSESFSTSASSLVCPRTSLVPATLWVCLPASLPVFLSVSLPV
eukprot:126031-Hanusia_phi.AAC.2